MGLNIGKMTSQYEREGNGVTYEEAVQAAEDELSRITYALECKPGVYDNPGLRKAYQNKESWLTKVVCLAEIALKGRGKEC